MRFLRSNLNGIITTYIVLKYYNNRKSLMHETNRPIWEWLIIQKMDNAHPSTYSYEIKIKISFASNRANRWLIIKLIPQSLKSGTNNYFLLIYSNLFDLLTRINKITI